MKKEFVPYELAVKLKELGFDEPCLDKYDPRFEKLSSNMETWSNEYYPENLMTPAPLYQQAFRFFREKYGIHLTIEYSYYSKKWVAMYCKIDLTTSSSLLFSKDTYEEAELACLTKLIEIVEQQKQK